jgi:hypothetical protein
MKMIKVELLPARDGDVVKGVLREQKRIGQGWVEVQRYELGPGAARVVLLEDDERIIIEGKASTKVIVDPIQGAAMEVPDLDTETEASELPEIHHSTVVGSVPITPGFECQTGVFRTAGANADRIRTGKPYRIYTVED